MDVRISYGINIDEIPEKTREMLEKFQPVVVERMVEISKQLLDLSGDNAATVVELLEKARLELSRMDRILNDSQMILKGYVETKKPKEVQSAD